MKTTLGWLKSHLSTRADCAAVAEALTHLGLEVDHISDPSATYNPFRVAQVLSCTRHPNADKLTVCTVAAGEDAVQVVCGAPNVRPHMKSIFAPVGTTIPGTGLVLKVTDIRGVKSHGMLCSAKELMLSEDHEGIVELPAEAPVGQSYATYAGLNDPVLDVAVTPNRADCLGVHGLARDLAAKGMGRLISAAVRPVKGQFKSPITVALEFPKTLTPRPCSLFATRLIRGVHNGESPPWLQARLRAIGLRPISALVDISNYITFDRARPLHVYDASHIQGGLSARLARRGEILQALDGKTYTLSGDECVIADDVKVLGLGGVMGGVGSGCTAATTDVVIESALFDPARTAETGRRHAIESDARFRFERGVDPSFTLPGLELASRMILDLCGGRPSHVVAKGQEPARQKVITFRPSRLKTLAGAQVPASTAKSILQKLGFRVNGSATFKVTVPHWRQDMGNEADVVEEVMRVHGYDTIPTLSLPPAAAVPVPVLSPAQKRIRSIRRSLAAAGLNECVTYSFVSPAVAKLFGGGLESLTLENPISVGLSVMRPSLVPNLITAAQRNADRAGQAIALFEIGAQYASDAPEGEVWTAAGVRVGPKTPRHWKKSNERASVLDAKSDACAVLRTCGLDPNKTQVVRTAPAWYHPFRSGTLQLGPHKTLGHFGEVHPLWLKTLGADGPMSVFEVFLNALPRAKVPTTRSKGALALSQLPAVERDFAFVVDTAVAAAIAVDAIRKAARDSVRDIEVFDVFEGKGLPQGKKSIALAVRLEPKDKTFTEADIESLSRAIVAAVESATSGKLRS